MKNLDVAIKEEVIKNIICPVCKEIGVFNIRFFVNRKTNLEVGNPLFVVKHKNNVSHSITKYLRYLYN